MALCLGHPRHGYYMTRDPLGAGGDFTTAPEISQIFGELLGLWAVATWQQMGSPSRFNLVELGPGRGTLMSDALRAARLVPPFGAAVHVHLVETSPVLRGRQKAMLADAGVPLAWHDRIEDLPGDPAIVLANEFFDALPISQFQRSAQGWHERRIGLDEAGALVIGVDPRPAPFAQALARHVPEPHPVGAVLEHLESDAPAALAAHLSNSGGAALVIDYGYERSALGDTLQALAQHRFVDPLHRPGEADLTAHVDFAALARTAEATGTPAHGPLPQGEFLARLGLHARADRLKRDAAPAQREAIDLAVARLAGTGQTAMGTLFKVLALSHPSLGTPPGFAPEEAFVARWPHPESPS
ncbi:MAG: methyltransferase [Rhizobiales bacterium 32-66-8]|nr:MAG: methyltransferase [Rhizobiales bacterium 32-66-8]